LRSGDVDPLVLLPEAGEGIAPAALARREMDVAAGTDRVVALGEVDGGAPGKRRRGGPGVTGPRGEQPGQSRRLVQVTGKLPGGRPVAGGRSGVRFRSDAEKQRLAPHLAQRPFDLR